MVCLSVYTYELYGRLFVYYVFIAPLFGAVVGKRSGACEDAKRKWTLAQFKNIFLFYSKTNPISLFP